MFEVNKGKMQSRLYGLEVNNLEEVSQVLQGALKIQFQLHESLYLGEYFLFRGEDGEQIRLRKNLDPLDGGPVEPEFKDKPLLIEIEDYPESSKMIEEIDHLIRTSIPKAQLLRKSTN